ncbi:hypothetical protein [Flavobacterium sharifuzzamanii]|uniref:hypothetical protein n=1 Tax=Flavobacterium sharifuzzamanii TaxID=2211133 RepID=UPI00193EA4B9|nr:hypothetical protein [Flavobacterium sharifuzzamanii]
MKLKLALSIILISTLPSYSQQIGNGYATYLQDFTTPLFSGVYGGPNAIGKAPDNSHDWQHLFVIRHANSENNYQLQLSSAYSENDKLFFRKIDNSVNPAWYELATRGVNTFRGNQTVLGSLNLWETNESRPYGQNVESKSVLKLSRNGTNGYSWNEHAEFRIGHGGTGTTGSKLELFINGNENTTSIPDQQVMTWNYNGNVGIGQTNPNNKLDVNGTIHSKEVKVDMTGWSDFVFKKEYDLPTLEQVEKHIVEKGHLENIPSEEEVLKNGINLGEMNAKLLQKIEELTLYIIEQSKELNNQKIEIIRLNKYNTELELIKSRILQLEKKR